MWGDGDYFEGAAMVVNPDGTGLQILAQNFRNPYELAVDAFGDIWQTDNDDDGNAWTRANYVIAGGNYGFRGPRGRSWREDAGSHFHEELPGVVPNMIRLGPGSPCGLAVYEGTLLPPDTAGICCMRRPAGACWRTIRSFPTALASPHGSMNWSTEARTPGSAHPMWPWRRMARSTSPTGTIPRWGGTALATCRVPGVASTAWRRPGTSRAFRRLTFNRTPV